MIKNKETFDKSIVQLPLFVYSVRYKLEQNTQIVYLQLKRETLLNTTAGLI